MNKPLLVFGIILCLAGVLTLSYNRPVKKTQTSIVPHTMEEQGQNWIYSVNFDGSEKILVEIRGPKNQPNIWWYNDLYEPETDSNPLWNPYAPVELNVTLIPPDNEKTVFCIWFVWDYLGGLTVKNLTLLNGKTGSLENLSLTYTYTRGIIKGDVKEKGTYSFQVPMWYWMRVQGIYYPPELRFLKEGTVDTYPYSNLLPVGIGLLLLGSATSIFGIKKKKGGKRYMLKSRKRSR